MPRYYTAAGVRKIAAAGLQWTCRLEFRGYNSQNQSRHSEKFWECSAVGFGTVHLSWGRLTPQGDMTKGRRTKPYSYFSDTVVKKLAKGYGYKKGSLDDPPKPKKKARTAKQIKAGKVKRGHRKARVPWKGSPLGTPPAPKPSLPQPAPIPQPLPKTAGLTGPWAEVAALMATKDGFDALDKTGKVLMAITSEGGRKLSQKHNVPVLNCGF